MKYKKRRFFAGECMHVYQRAVNGFNIFYEVEDYLVFYTILSTVARLYKVTILQLCIMINHIHLLLSADNVDSISAFIMHYTSVFAREYNNDIGRRGPLFHKSFGSAPKQGGKQIRSTIVYIGNNPVEKDLCKSADEYRWNFLSYVKRRLSDQNMAIRHYSKALRRAIKVVDSMSKENLYLNYTILRRLMKKLDSSEREMLTDYIIMLYYPFDTDAFLGYYRSYDDMITAMRSTSGKEYDINELYTPEPDTVFERMSEVLSSKCAAELNGHIKNAIVMNPEEKFNLALLLRRLTSASTYQISRFLHMPVLTSDDKRAL